ncbi:MAG: diacylglycerol kinase family protein [Actinomycetota bacterium]
MTSAFGDLTVIANPDAGGGGVRTELPDLERALEERDLPYTLHVAESRGDATALAARALRGGARFLVAVGGDGTVQQVVNGMFGADGRPLVSDPVLGVVAAGSGCDLVRSFGLPGDTRGAVGHLTGSNTYAFDVVKISCTGPGGEPVTRYSHNLAEAGFGAAVLRRRAALPDWTGRARSFLAFWLTFARTRLAQVTVRADTKVYEGPAFNVIVANAQFSGGGLRMSPRSFPGDGILDALVFRGPRSDAFTMLPRIYRHGDHVPDPHIHEMRAKIRVAVESDRPLPVEADGEVLGTTPVTFQIVPRALLLKL